MIKKVDVFAALTVAVALILGITGKVDWWVVGLILLSHIHVEIPLEG